MQVETFFMKDGVCGVGDRAFEGPSMAVRRDKAFARVIKAESQLILKETVKPKLKSLYRRRRELVETVTSLPGVAVRRIRCYGIGSRKSGFFRTIRLQ